MVLFDEIAEAARHFIGSGEGRLIALHHQGGRPQEILGKPPLRKNEGIRISRVIQGLKASGVPVA